MDKPLDYMIDKVYAPGFNFHLVSNKERLLCGKVLFLKISKMSSMHWSKDRVCHVYVSQCLLPADVVINFLRTQREVSL